MKEVFRKTYDGEAIADIGRDIYEAFDERFNPSIDLVEFDCHGIIKGGFTLILQYSPNEEG